MLLVSFNVLLFTFKYLNFETYEKERLRVY